MPNARPMFAMFGIGCALLSMSAPPHAAAGERPTVVKDALYGEVLFYFYQEDFFPAIVRLLAARSQSKLDHHRDESELLLGGMYLSYGQHREAAAIFERLLADNVQPEIRDRTWFFLARIWKQRGYLRQSAGALDRIEGELPENLRREALMLRAQLLIDSGDYDAAIDLLDNWKGKTEWASYAKFNLGVALVRSGRVDAAARMLGELGGMKPFNDELASLRDKANVALGYAYLQNGRPVPAKRTLQRVRLEGPFSNKALLGVGWADAETGAFDRALVPWMELRRRDLLDSAVQESMLAIPYALASLDSISQAADHYLHAIEAFHEESGRLDRTIDHIASGSFFNEIIADDPLDSTGWYWRMDRLPDGPQSRYLLHLLSTHAFQEGLKNLRDLHYSHRNLENWQRRVDVFHSMLETRIEAFEHRLPRVQNALRRADLDGMVDRKLEFDAVLNDIERSRDWLALATAAELGTWGEITSLESTPALAADIPEAADIRAKVALLKGVLQWQLEKEFKERAWRIRRELRRTGEALVEMQRARRKIDESMRRQPVEFAELSQRVAAVLPRIEAMQSRLEDQMAMQRSYLRSIAIDELDAQKERLAAYTVQARFALAAIYDIAATVGEAGP